MDVHRCAVEVYKGNPEAWRRRVQSAARVAQEFNALLSSPKEQKEVSSHKTLLQVCVMSEMVD
jgi:hypothetical protein